MKDAELMCWRDITNAIKGMYDLEKERSSILFEQIRFLAAHITMSSKQYRAIQKARNPYNKKPIPTKPMTMDEVLKSLPRGLN